MSKYQPLAEYLAAQSSDRATLSFAQIKRLLGRPLLRAAREHRAWWGNERCRQHVQARS